MDNLILELWQKTLNLLKVELTDVSFNTWIKTIEPLVIRMIAYIFVFQTTLLKGSLNLGTPASFQTV